LEKSKASLNFICTKIPTNISAALRKYTAYVEPVAGTPLKWRLKTEGLAKLRALSGLALTASPSSEAFESDIGIICALEQPELEAVIEAFGGPNVWKEVGKTRYTHVYRETKLNTESGKTLRVIATASTSMGLTAAAIATTQMIMQFRPRLVVMVGIAAGTRSGNKQFGDVLVADPSVDYNSGKVVDAKGIREFLPDPYPIGLNGDYEASYKDMQAIRKCLPAFASDGAALFPQAQTAYTSVH
jgi:hypothetical protein